MLQCVAVCCSVSQSHIPWSSSLAADDPSPPPVTVCCSVLQCDQEEDAAVLECVAVCWSVLQCVGVC